MTVLSGITHRRVRGVTVELQGLRVSKGRDWMSIIAWIVFGLIVGVIAKMLLPGNDPGGFIMTVVLGIVGALVGGFIVGLLTRQDFTTHFNFASILVSILGAIVVLLIYRAVASRST